MSAASAARPARSELLRGLREPLRALDPPLEVLAERLLGLEARIDLVTCDGRGQVVLVSLAEPGQELTCLADALAQRAWLEPRLPDWLKLAPQLPVDPTLGVRALLLTSRHEARALAAAGASGGALELALYRWSHRGDRLELAIEPLGSAQPGDPPEHAGCRPAPESRFRTGLLDADLGLPEA